MGHTVTPGGFPLIRLQQDRKRTAQRIPRWDGRHTSNWIEGIGIHTGSPARVRFHHTPFEPVVLLRDGVSIPLLAEFVLNTNLATEIGHQGVSVSTTEHLLAALYVLGHWTGFAIEVDGPEIPILDGSAIGWAQALADVDPEPAPAALVPQELAIEVRGGYVGLETIAPGSPMQVQVAISYPHPAIQDQTWAGTQNDWAALLDARTFGFARDLERLWASGRGLGYDGQNVVVYEADGPTLTLRGQDEPVRHKALDLLGDLYLVGQPLEALVVSERAGHPTHINLALELRHRSPDLNADLVDTQR